MNYLIFNNNPNDLKTFPYGLKQNSSYYPMNMDTNGNIMTGINGITPVIGSMYDRLQVAEYELIFSIPAAYGISGLRDVTTIAGSATITNAGNGYTLTTTTAATDSAKLDTAERGRYSTGNGFEAGIVCQVVTAPSNSSQVVQWGIFDDTNGMYFGQDTTGVYVASLKSGVETKVYKSNWNIDKLDGSGPSGLTLDTSDGHMYQMRFAYNFGIIEYRVVMINSITYEQTPIVCHRTETTSGVLIGDVNQPVRAYVNSGGVVAATGLELYIRGRYYANLGFRFITTRITSERRLSRSTNNTTFVPTVSFQRLSTFPSSSSRVNSINVTIDSFDIISSEDVIWQLRLNSTLTGASFGNPSNTPSTETCLQSDVSATAIDVGTGILIMEGLAVGGANKINAISTIQINTVLPGLQTMTLCVMNVSATSGLVSVVLRAHEEW